MRPRIVAFAMLLMLCFAAAANADQWYGPFQADGIGMSERMAANNAHQTLDNIVEGWKKSMEGKEAMVVINQVDWDFPVYTIEYWIVVVDSPK